MRVKLEHSSPQRADLALRDALKAKGQEISRARLKSLFKDGVILLRARAIPASLVLEPAPHGIELEIAVDIRNYIDTAPAIATDAGPPAVFENSELLILHKPHGMPSIPLSSADTRTALNYAHFRFPGFKWLAEHTDRDQLEAGILHRLDTGTSGLLAFAKTPEIWKSLRSAWKEGRVQKTYRALCRRKPDYAGGPIQTGLISTPLAHDAKSKRRMVALPSARKIRGQPLPAKTEILSVISLPGGILDVELRIHTGVMHQIRCHLASLGWPILGDSIYGGCPSSRLWLHAWKLDIPLPNRPALHITAAMPQRWARPAEEADPVSLKS